MTPPLLNVDALVELVRQVVREELDRRQNGAELLTVAEAAQIANVEPETIRSWVGSGTLAHRRIGNRTKGPHIRIARGDLEAALKPGARHRDRELSPQERARRDLAKVSR